MARYIDAEKIEYYEHKKIGLGIDYGLNESDTYYTTTKEKIDAIPTADVVEVVRCKDCKHRGGTFHADRRRKDGGYWVYWCELDTGDLFELGRNAWDDNWFCADGERRDEE